MRKYTFNGSLILKISFLLLITVTINQAEITSTCFTRSYLTADTEQVYTIEEVYSNFNTFWDDEAEYDISCNEIFSAQFDYSFYLKYIKSVLFHEFNYLTNLNLEIKKKTFKTFYFNKGVPDNSDTPLS